MRSKPFVFVAMPFSAKFINVYELGIKPACEAAGADCARVDEQIFDEEILHRIYSQIESADLIIGEMTERNPNVYYEVGYAKGHNKNVLLITEKPDDTPFDLKAYRHVTYEGRIATLRVELEKNVRWFLGPASQDGSPFPIAGIWNGEVIAEHPNPDHPRSSLTMEFRWMGQVVGYGSIAVPNREPIHLHFTGNFRHGRYLMLTYMGSERGVMQFGAVVLRLNGTNSRLEGYYVGYGAISDSLVYGRLTLARASGLSH